jgi:fructose-1,6-bisphosphatase/inositol monophosphatase family enzyme
MSLAEAVQVAVDALEGDPSEVVGRGADGAPSRRIDRVAEDAVLQTLDSKKAPLDVLSEEAGFINRGGESILVLDPIDGTHNAIRGVPAFSVSMAIGHSHLGDVTEALVRDLAQRTTFHAEKGHGATLDGTPIHVRPFNPRDTLVTVYLGTNAAPDANAVAAKARRVRNLGAASLDLCLVARGAADMYFMHSAVTDAKLRVVDIAGGVLIVREAGGRVLDLAGRDLDMKLETSARTDLIAVGDPKALEVLR